MDLTTILGSAAIVVTFGTVLLLLREVASVIWSAAPDWFRFALGAILVLVLYTAVRGVL